MSAHGSVVGDSGGGSSSSSTGGHAPFTGETQHSQVGITYLTLALSTWHACTGDAPALLAIIAVAVLSASPRLLRRRVRRHIRCAVIHGGRCAAADGQNVGFENGGEGSVTCAESKRGQPFPQHAINQRLDTAALLSSSSSSFRRSQATLQRHGRPSTGPPVFG